MGSIADTELLPGQILAGKFRVEKVLGRGGMGVVIAATHLQLDEYVAIKFLLPEALENKEAVGRFEREARAAAKIRSEHVARVSDVGRLDSGEPYMVMEHLTGMDLKEYLSRSGPLPVEEAAHYILQACEALAEAHALGIVHRDLKPANLFRIIRADGTPSVKVLDFGISKLANADVSMTRTSMMMGSPYYMSPEQMSSAKDVDARTDIWALGVIVHQLVTGDVPFPGDTIAEVCNRVLQTPSPRLSAWAPTSPEGLQHVIDRALEKDRTKRFSDVAEFTRALSAFAPEDDLRSVERISRVLGVAPTVAHPNTEKPSAAGIEVQETVFAGQSPGDTGDGTLQGAAHTHVDYKPPTSSAGGWLTATALLLFIAAGGVWATSGTSERDNVQEEGDAAPSTNPEQPKTQGAPVHRGDSSQDRSASPIATAQSPSSPPAPARVAPAPPVPVPPPRAPGPTPQATPKPKPQTTPTPQPPAPVSNQPAESQPPSSQPAAAPDQAADDPVDYYMDRQ